MATTAFWPVYNHLKETIDYAENPDKTIERKYVDEDLYKTLQYAENSKKTDETMYVSAINCPKQKAYEYMMRTKRLITTEIKTKQNSLDQENNKQYRQRTDEHKNSSVFCCPK